jgi:hypothetical protein
VNVIRMKRCIKSDLMAHPWGVIAEGSVQAAILAQCFFVWRLAVR